MSWLSFLNRKSLPDKNANPQRVATPHRTASGIVITPDRALLNATAWACRRYLSQSAGLLPARILQSQGRFSKLIDNHPVDTVLNWRPNPELAPFQLRETLTSWAITHGNGIAEIEKDLVGRASGIWPLEPWKTSIQRYKDSRELVYFYDMGSGQKPAEFGPNDVLHIRGFGDGAVGISVAEYAAQTIGWARATEIFGASFFSRGLHFGGTAILKKESNEEQIESIQTRLEESFAGASNNSKWFVGDGDMQITRMSSTPNESQFVETMQHQIEEICRWFGVPPHKVMHLLRATFSNIESQSIEVVTDSIAPWALRWEQECSYKLFGQNRGNLKVEFDLKGMLRGAYKDRQEGLQIMRRNGVINGDEWRELEGMGPIGSEQGQIYLVEENMIPLDIISEVKLAKAQKQKEKANSNAAPNTATNDNQLAALFNQIDEHFKFLEVI